jgi:hypothetical protein
MRRFSLVLLVALAAAGCKKKQPAEQPQVVAPAESEAGAATIKGKVIERLDAAPYSYLKIEAEAGEVWAAVPKTDVQKGGDIVVTGAMPMNEFESKTLQRKFDVIYFGTVAGSAEGADAPQVAAVDAGGGMAAQHAAAAAGPADAGSVKVPKASGADARTVAEVYAQRTALKEKSVTVRGKVVKYNEGIMGLNWIHIRDGSGTAGKDNDLTVTTNDRTNVGDVILVKGTVRTEKDFGAGYSYPVIVEDAKISK